MGILYFMQSSQELLVFDVLLCEYSVELFRNFHFTKLDILSNSKETKHLLRINSDHLWKDFQCYFNHFCLFLEYT